MSIARETARSSGRWSWLPYVGAGRSVAAAALPEEARKCWQPIGAVWTLWPAGAASPSGRLPCHLPPGFIRIECNPVLRPYSPCLQSLSSFTVLRKVLQSLSVPLAGLSSLSSPHPNPAQSVWGVEGPRLLSDRLLGRQRGAGVLLPLQFAGQCTPTQVEQSRTCRPAVKAGHHLVA